MENEYLKLCAALPALVSKSKIDDNVFSLNFKLLDTVSSSDLESTVCKDIKILVTIKNKLNGSMRSEPLLITKIPVETHLGYKINGTFYSMMGVDKRACGWYISYQNRGGNKTLTLEFIPFSGMRMIFLERNSKIQVFFNLKNFNKRVPLGVFLKALTGKNYQELIAALGVHNKYILQSFTNEQPRDFCLNKTLSAMSLNTSKLPENVRFKELKRRLTDKHSLNPGNAFIRTSRQIKFAERAVDKILVEPVLSYKRGTILTKEILEEIDNSDVDTLLVKYEGKVFELKKYSISGENTFSEGELFTLINMYATSLDGFSVLDDSLELTNRRTQSYKDSACEVVQTALDRIEYSVREFFRNSGKNADLATYKFPVFKPDDYINRLKTSIEVQNSETINGISLASKTDKIVSDLSGRVGESFVKVKDTERFLYDALAQPESKKIGFVHYKTLGTKLSEDGELTGTFLKVVNGKPQTEAPVYLNAYTIKNSIIAPWDADLTKPQAVCLVDGRTILVPVQDIQYIEWSPFCEFALSTALIPFIQFSDGKRNTMGGNFAKQAVQTIHRERPLVSTGVCAYFDLGIVRCKDILERYYIEHSNTLPYTLEEFLKAKIKINTTEITIPGYRQLFCNILCDDNNYLTKYSIPYSKRTIDSTLVQFNINSSPNGDWIYNAEDIICYDSSYTLDKAHLIVHSDLGFMKPKTEEELLPDLAVGNNFLVGWKVYDSTTVDDSFTISAGLWGTNKLAHCAAYEKKAKLKEPTRDDPSYETFELKDHLPGFGPNGLPKIGTYLKPGSIVISRVLHTENGDHSTSIRLDADTEGEVIAASITPEGEAIVYLARIADISLGDKVCGRHGNKGTIGSIVPESDMPYLEDGTPLDFCMNPLAVPSRANLSQFLEGIMGWAARLQGKDVSYVISTQNRNSYDIVQDTIEKFNIHPQTVYDGKTSLPFPRKINVGYLYVEKLRHDSISKSNATAINTRVNPETLQARKGKKVGGGQTIGEMETWALLSAGATRPLQEIFSLLSNDSSNKANVKRYAETGDPNYISSSNNNNDSALLVPCRSLGVDIVNDPEFGYKEKIMTDEDICALAPKAIDLHVDALQDSVMFGSVSETYNLEDTRKKWGYMPLNCEIISPLWLYEGNLCKLIIATFEEYDAENDRVVSKTKNLNSLLVRKVILTELNKNFEEKTYLAVENGTIFISHRNDLNGRFWKCGMSIVVEAFKVANLSIAENFYKHKLQSDFKLTNDEIFKIKETLSTINDLAENYGDLSFAVISHFPIMPRNFRLPAMGRQSNFDMHYGNIISAAIAAKNVDKSTEVFRRIVAFTGLDDKMNNRKDLISLLNFFTGKNQDTNDGFLRDHTLSTVVDMSLRGVITPAPVGLLKITEIGIPYTKALVCLQDFIKPKVINYFKDIAPTHNILDEDNLIDGIYSAILNKDAYALTDLLPLTLDDARQHLDILIEAITEYCETKVVALGRQPTLHKYGIRGFRMKLVEGSAIKLHPTVCKAYNADFDGDQMYGVIMLSEEAAHDLLRTMSPACDLLNPKDDSFVLEPTQDTLLGIYLMTMLKDNVVSIKELPDYYTPDSVVYYNDIALLRNDIDSQIIEPYRLVCFNKNSKCYLSTAGRILFNSCLPDCFTDGEFTNPLGLDFIDPSGYYELRFDALVKSKGKDDSIVSTTIKDVDKYLYENYNGEQVCEAINGIFIFGTIYSTALGISLSYDDYVEHPDLEKLRERADVLTQEVNMQYDFGLLSEAGRKESTAKINNLVIDYVKKTLMNYYSRNNNLFIMMDSGAKGNISQITKACGFIGNIARSSSESLETPVLSNYRRGLSSMEQASIAYGTRRGFSSTLNDTALAGTLTRAAVDTLAGFKIVEHDCENETATFEVLYSDTTTSIKFKGEEVTFDSLIGLSFSVKDPNYQNFLSLDDNSFNTKHIYYITKNHIRQVYFTDGILEIKYKVSKLFRNLVKNRLAKNLPYLYVPKASNSDSSGFITDKTIDFIEESNLEFIEVRTMLSCNSVGGVCARCYGLKPDSKKYPLVGEYIGITAAQALGEPATQLTMNVNNQGGAAGTGMVSGVSTFKAYMGGSVPGNAPKVVVAQYNGFVKLSLISQDYYKLELGRQVEKVHHSSLIVKNGEHVSMGQALTTGCLNVNDIVLKTNEETLRRRQLELLKILYGIFQENDIDVNARVFEVIVRAQTSLVRILESEDPRFKEGYTYFLQELQKADVLDKVSYYSKVEKTPELINHYSSNIANLTHSFFSTNLAKGVLIPGRRDIKSRGPLAKLAVGENLVTNQVKKLNTLSYVNLDRILDESNAFESCKEVESIAVSEVKTVRFDDISTIDLFGELGLVGTPTDSNEIADLVAVTESDEKAETITGSHVFSQVKPDNSSEVGSIDNDNNNASDNLKEDVVDVDKKSFQYDFSFDDYDDYNDDDEYNNLESLDADSENGDFEESAVQKVDSIEDSFISRSDLFENTVSFEDTDE